MFPHPYISSQIASDRHREMVANAEQHRLVRQFRAQAGASRHAGRAARRLSRSLRIATSSHTEFPP
jgi:hypothetical protein